MTNQTDILKNIIDAITDKKGKKITLIDLSKFQTAPTENVVICQGNNITQVSAIADNIHEKLIEQCGLKPLNIEGYRNSQWIIIDYGYIMIHVFLPDFRNFYNLEELWNDAPIENLPDID